MSTRSLGTWIKKKHNNHHILCNSTAKKPTCGSKLKRTRVSFRLPCPRLRRSRLSRLSLLESVAWRCRTRSCFLPLTNCDMALVRSGWNLRKEAQAMASWTMPSCHMKAANTARRHSATEGDSAWTRKQRVKKTKGKWRGWARNQRVKKTKGKRRGCARNQRVKKTKGKWRGWASNQRVKKTKGKRRGCARNQRVKKTKGKWRGWARNQRINKRQKRAARQGIKELTRQRTKGVAGPGIKELIR